MQIDRTVEVVKSFSRRRRGTEFRDLYDYRLSTTRARPLKVRSSPCSFIPTFLFNNKFL